MKTLKQLHSRLIVTAAVMGLILPVTVQAGAETNYYKDASMLGDLKSAVSKMASQFQSALSPASGSNDGELTEEQIKNMTPEEIIAHNEKSEADQKKHKEKLQKFEQADEKISKDTKDARKQAKVVSDIKDRAVELKAENDANARKAGKTLGLNQTNTQSFCGLQKAKEASCNVNIDEVCQQAARAASQPGQEANTAMKDILKELAKGDEIDKGALQSSLAKFKDARKREAEEKQLTEDEQREKAEFKEKNKGKSPEEIEEAWAKRLNPKNPKGSYAKLFQAQQDVDKAFEKLVEFVMSEKDQSEGLEEVATIYTNSRNKLVDAMANSAGNIAGQAWTNLDGVTEGQIGAKHPSDKNKLLGAFKKKTDEVYDNKPFAQRQDPTALFVMAENNRKKQNENEKYQQFLQRAQGLAKPNTSSDAKNLIARLKSDDIRQRGTNVRNMANAILADQQNFEAIGPEFVNLIQPQIQACDQAHELKKEIETRVAAAKKNLKTKQDEMAQKLGIQPGGAPGVAAGGGSAPRPGSLAGGSNPGQHFSGRR